MLACLDRSNNENVDLVPCDPTGVFKSCCSRGDSCASNGLCVTSEKNPVVPYSINGCLVEDWDDPTCPTQCFNVSGNGVKACGVGQFCCFGTKGCDCKEDEVFAMEPVRIIANIPLKPSIAIAITTISYEVFSPIDTTSLTPCTSTTDAPITNPPEDNNNMDLPIGLGVGIGTALALFTLGAGLFFFILKRASKLETVASKNSSQESFMSYDDEKHLLPSVPVELHCTPARAELP